MATEYRSDASDLGDTVREPERTVVVDPNAVDEAGGTASEPAPQRKRRRDAGQPRGPRGTSAKKESVPLDLSSITGLLVGIHALLAQVTETPEIAITEDEGKAFTKASQNVMRHYSVQTTQKTLDWIALIGVAASIYGPRLAAVGIRKRSEKEPKTAKVIQFPNAAGPVDLSDYQPA